MIPGAACGTVTVGYQGAPGANGERAIAAHWRGDARPLAMRSFPLLLDAVADGALDYGVVPVWNSAIGEVHEACTALENLDDRVEQIVHVTIAVRHALLALPGVSLSAVRAVGSHPAALAQCQAFITAHAPITPVAAWDTAGAAAELAALARDADAEADAAVTPWHAGLIDAAPARLAAIANAELAAPLGLVVLAHDIHDDPDNRTRFAVVRARAGAWLW